MSTKAADDFEAIRRRLEEIEAEQKLALTGSSAPVSEEPKDVESVYGIDYSAWNGAHGLATAVLMDDKIFFQHDGNTYETPSYLGWSPSDVNDAARNYLAQRNQYQAAANNMKSLAHPEWPYAGTGFEWRRFVRS